MKKIVRLLPLLALIVMVISSCTKDDNYVEADGGSSAQLNEKLQLSALAADAEATRTYTAANSNDKVVLWEATGEMIHLWTTYENEPYVYLDAFKQSS